jgi:hypothetical protein
MSRSKDIPRELLFTVCTPQTVGRHPEFAELLIAYAHAMWSWSRLEATLFQIFADTVEPTTNHHADALRAAFFSIVSAKSRIDMIHSVARARWHGKLHWAEWAKLYNECVKQLRVRGRIAHLVGYSYAPNARGKKVVAALAEAIHHPSAPHAHKDLKQKGITVDDLRSYVDCWELLSQRLQVFRLLAREQAQPQASAELSADLLRLLQTQLGPIGKAPSEQQKPSPQ